MFASLLPGVPQAAGRNCNNRSAQSPHGVKCGAVSTRLSPANAKRSTCQQLPCYSLSGRSRSIVAQAQKGQPDPPDAPRDERRGGREWLQTLLSRFGPITQKAENTAVLDFEKPLVELDNRIKEVKPIERSWDGWLLEANSLTRVIQVRKVAEENGVDVSESIRELEERAKQVTCCFCLSHLQ